MNGPLDYEVQPERRRSDKLAMAACLASCIVGMLCGAVMGYLVGVWSCL